MKRSLWLAVLAAGWVHPAMWQSAAANQGAVPAPSAVSVAPYRSTFENYRPWTDEAPQDWRHVNDEMQRLGGHVGHFRPQAGDKPAAARGETATPGMPMHGSTPHGAQEKKQ